MNFLRSFFSRPPALTSPSPEYPTPLDLLLHALPLMDSREHSWLTLTAGPAQGVPEAVVQYAPGSINTLHDTPDLPAILRQAGLTALAEFVHPREPGLFDLPDPDHAEVAAIIDALFRAHFGMTGNYPLRGELEA